MASSLMLKRCSPMYATWFTRRNLKCGLNRGYVPSNFQFAYHV
jgi:hypothetical protein